MPDLDALDILFIITAFLFEIILIIHFALRRWRFSTAMRGGPVIYALGIPAAVVSAVLLAGGKSWWFGPAGFLFLAWSAFGYTVEYIYKIEWRNPFKVPVGVPYLLLYLGTTMFYWFPLLRLWKPLWYAFALLYIVSTYLNATSHHSQPELARLETPAGVSR